jgi:hypothetical protein
MGLTGQSKQNPAIIKERLLEHPPLYKALKASAL